MVARQRDLKIPSELIPYCPICGKPMAMNLRCDDTFVEDTGWQTAASNYQAFLQENESKHVLFLELGVGNNTPVIIKYPFWQMTYENTQAFYVCINQGEATAPREIITRSICLNADIKQTIIAMKKY